jgi:hypothetical protein
MSQSKTKYSFYRAVLVKEELDDMGMFDFHMDKIQDHIEQLKKVDRGAVNYDLVGDMMEELSNLLNPIESKNVWDRIIRS